MGQLMWESRLSGWTFSETLLNYFTNNFLSNQKILKKVSVEDIPDPLEKKIRNASLTGFLND